MIRLVLGVDVWSRSEIISWLQQRLADDAGVAVGEHGSPPDVGWVTGEPNVGDFVPYLVVFSGLAQPNRDGLTDTQWHWNAQFTVRAWSETRAECDSLVEAATQSLLRARRQCWFEGWFVDHVRVDSLSAVQVNKQFNPYLYSAGVSFTCALMKK